MKPPTTYELDKDFRNAEDGFRMKYRCFSCGWTCITSGRPSKCLKCGKEHTIVAVKAYK